MPGARWPLARLLGAGVSRQPIIVMMMGRAGGGHLVHTRPLLSTATVLQWAIIL